MTNRRLAIGMMGLLSLGLFLNGCAGVRGAAPVAAPQTEIRLGAVGLRSPGRTCR